MRNPIPTSRHSGPMAGFSLLELLTVVAIIGILAGIGAPMITSAQRQARQADCRSNLRQFGIALASYRSDHNGRNPPWLSHLFPEYIDGKDIYVCKSDRDVKKDLGNYDPVPKDFPAAVDHFSQVDDFDGKRSKGTKKEDKIYLNSYFYEFSSAEVPSNWGLSGDQKKLLDLDEDGKVSWAEYKEGQLQYGNNFNADEPRPWSSGRLPIVRCWHHGNEDTVLGFEQKDSQRTRLKSFPLVLNVGYAGNVFASPPWWEGRPDVGEK